MSWMATRRNSVYLDAYQVERAAKLLIEGGGYDGLGAGVALQLLARCDHETAESFAETWRNAMDQIINDNQGE